MNEQERVDLHERLTRLEEQMKTIVKLVEKMDSFIDRWKIMGIIFMAIGGGFVFILDHWNDLVKVITRWLVGH